MVIHEQMAEIPNNKTNQKTHGMDWSQMIEEDTA